MKKSLLLLVGCALLSTNLTFAQWSSKNKIQGNGNIVSEKRTTTDYDAIAVSGFFDVELVSGKEGDITVKGEENLIPFLKIEVVNNILKISSEKNKYLSTSKGKQILISVPFEEINKISLTGSGDVNTKKTINSNSLSVQLTGSGDINLEVASNSVAIDVTGSGDVTISGTTEELNTALNGSGDIDTSKLKAKNVHAAVSGSGDTTVFCSDNLHARVSGSGDIQYKGDPKKKDTKVSGSGSISKS
nr:head GIN domain-containing protein [uncultured Flavobacterium sp.]